MLSYRHVDTVPELALFHQPRMSSNVRMSAEITIIIKQIFEPSVVQSMKRGLCIVQGAQMQHSVAALTLLITSVTIQIASFQAFLVLD